MGGYVGLVLRKYTSVFFYWSFGWVRATLASRSSRSKAVIETIKADAYANISNHSALPTMRKMTPKPVPFLNLD